MSILFEIFPKRELGKQVVNKKGEKRWKKVEVKLKDHIKTPRFPDGMSREFYDNCLDDYLSKIAMEELPQSQPLWEIHIIKYPTSEAEGNAIFKLHHSLGDGFSLMGALLSCLQRADNPAIPLTFPSVQLHNNNNLKGKRIGICRSLVRFFSSVVNTASDLWADIGRSSLVEDDKSPIRSAHPGVEFLPVSVVTLSFSLHHIKQIRAKLGAVSSTCAISSFFSYYLFR